jgi:hypothetical protein
MATSKSKAKKTLDKAEQKQPRARKARTSRAGRTPPAPPTRYLVRHGAHISMEDAEILGPAIQRVIDAGAPNAARALLDLAESPGPDGKRLRKYFEWNNVKAGHFHRLAQARTYISSIQIEVIVQRRVVRTPAFVPTYRNRGEYVDIGTAVQHEDIVESLLREALQGIRAYQLRFAMLRERVELAGLFEVIERVLAEHPVIVR